MKITGIYGLQNKLHPEKWYIGYSKDIYKRWNKQYRYLRCQKQPKLFAALKLHGYDNFEKVVLEECVDDRSVWGPKETYWIHHYNSIENGYNLVEGGEGGDRSSGIKRSEAFKENLRRLKTGVKRSSETIQRIKEARAKQVMKPKTTEQRMAIKARSEEYWKTHVHPFKGTRRPLSDEVKAKISATQKANGKWAGENNPNHRSHGTPKSTGRKKTVEERQKLSASLSGHGFSDETRRKMREAQKRRFARGNHPFSKKTFTQPSPEYQNTQPQG
jgi:group I intron endonuclease